MNSIENFVIDAVGDVLKERFPGIRVADEYTSSSAIFPLVTVVQEDSSEHIQSHTIEGEQATDLMFEVSVYSNTVGYKRLEANEIMDVVDDVMTGKIVTYDDDINPRILGFYRSMRSPIPNLQDASIYSLVARYKGVDKPEQHEDKTIHRIYIK